MDHEQMNPQKPHENHRMNQTMGYNVYMQKTQHNIGHWQKKTSFKIEFDYWPLEHKTLENNGDFQKIQ